MARTKLEQTAAKILDWTSLNKIIMWLNKLHDDLKLLENNNGLYVEATNITAGSTYVLKKNVGFQKLVAAGTLATLTLKMPPDAVNGSRVTFRPNFAVTTLTHQANTGQAIATGDNLTALVANTSYSYYYDGANWRRFQ